jgi:hypothetical protein
VVLTKGHMDSLEQQSALALLLDERLVEWEKARKPQEVKLLECYQDVMRIPREDDTKGTGQARAKKSTGIFVGSTRNKVRAARAKINDALFGSGKLPFDTSPLNEKLAPMSDAFEDILTDQLERGGFKPLLKAGVNALGKYGTAFMFGPFVRKEKIAEVSQGPDGQMVESEYAFDCPYFQLANTLDTYPDPEARELGAGLGVIWATMESPHTVAAWKNDERYSNIEAALLNPGDNSEQIGTERIKQLRGAVENWHKDGRIKVARFFGKIPADKMPKSEETAEGAKSELDDEPTKNDDMIDIIAVVAGGVVVRVEESPYRDMPALRCVYEDEEDEMWGVGIAENNSPHQKITNAAFRLFLEGKGMALLGTKAIDQSKFLPGEDFKKSPGKVYKFKQGLTADEKKEAIVNFVEPDVTGGWMDVIRASEQFSDDDTGITKYTQGDDSRNLNKTATGISMIMSASSLPIKEVIQNIDEMWIEQIIERLVEWDLKYLDVVTVQKIHGDKHAQAWAQIKQFGKSSFMTWKATGVSSFMQKEVLTNKLNAFSQFVMSNPATAAKVDSGELLRQTWDAMEMGRESPILEDNPDMANVPPQVQQQMQELQQHVEAMSKALENASAEVDKKDNEILKAQNDVLKAQADAIRSKTEADQIKAQQAIEAMKQQAIAEVQAERDQMQQELQAQMQPPVEKEPQQSMTADGGYALNRELAPVLQAVSSMQEPMQAVMQGMQQMMTQIAQVLEAANRPRQSTVKITKQADGSFVGEKTEV